MTNKCLKSVINMDFIQQIRDKSLYIVFLLLVVFLCGRQFSWGYFTAYDALDNNKNCFCEVSSALEFIIKQISFIIKRFLKYLFCFFFIYFHFLRLCVRSCVRVCVLVFNMNSWKVPSMIAAVKLTQSIISIT